MVSIYEYVYIKTGAPVYVGQSYQPKVRDKQHRSNHGSCPFDKVLRVSPSEYEFRILHSNLTQEEADYLETYYIVAHKTWHGFGKYNYFLSRYYDVQEHRAAISAALKGRKKPPEFAARIGAMKKGTRLSAEARANISKNHCDCSGDKNAFYGKKHTPETRKKLSEKRWHPKADGPEIVRLHDLGKSFQKIAKILGCGEASARRRYHVMRPNEVLPQTNFGPRNGRFGKPVSQETREKIRKAHLERHAALSGQPHRQ